VAVLSKLPLGAVTSWQHAVHPDDPGERVFGRDLLEVEVLNAARTQRLFTLYNTHLKSHFVPHDEDQEAGAAAANQRRTLDEVRLPMWATAQDGRCGHLRNVGRSAPTISARRPGCS
jgi:hypothetical protein